MSRTAARPVGIERVTTRPICHPRLCKQRPSALPTRPAPTMDNVSDIYCVSIQCPATLTVQKIRLRGKFNFAHLLVCAVRPDCLPLADSGNTSRRGHGPFAVAFGRSSTCDGRGAADFRDFCGAGRGGETP